jgi:hypothetical protein
VQHQRLHKALAFIYHIHATCPSHLILFDLVVLMIYNQMNGFQYTLTLNKYLADEVWLSLSAIRMRLYPVVRNLRPTCIKSWPCPHVRLSKWCSCVFLLETDFKNDTEEWYIVFSGVGGRSYSSFLLSWSRLRCSSGICILQQVSQQCLQVSDAVRIMFTCLQWLLKLVYKSTCISANLFQMTTTL